MQRAVLSVTVALAATVASPASAQTFDETVAFIQEDCIGYRAGVGLMAEVDELTISPDGAVAIEVTYDLSEGYSNQQITFALDEAYYRFYDTTPNGVSLSFDDMRTQRARTRRGAQKGDWGDWSETWHNLTSGIPCRNPERTVEAFEHLKALATAG